VDRHGWRSVERFTIPGSSRLLVNDPAEDGVHAAVRAALASVADAMTIDATTGACMRPLSGCRHAQARARSALVEVRPEATPPLPAEPLVDECAMREGWRKAAFVPFGGEGACRAP
jgi:hypothetical protein